ncbi:winged helix-turn-helix domain-containing protein [Streptomyces sp. NBC_00015]|uniref:helix-turn-helix domain-containing protein n=1 Tax=Streptomyces sp. NBC_00015 TaxID=2903611 RepID=UPI0032559DDD
MSHQYADTESKFREGRIAQNRIYTGKVTVSTGVVLSRASVWRLLTGRLGWSLQRPERRAVERDESEIARWIAHEWPRIKRGR